MKLSGDSVTRKQSKISIHPKESFPGMNTYSGSCHCGKVCFSVADSLSDPVICNCTFCRKRGAILKKVAASAFELGSGEDCLSFYGNRDFSDHYFCNRCGIHVFTRSSRNGEDAVVVNLGCIEGIDRAELKPRLFDGATLL